MPRGALQCGTRYLALDELLEIPRVRILRALRHFDWASSEDIRIALDIDAQTALAFNTNMSRLVKERRIDRVGTSQLNYRYRINDAGRAQLKQLLGRAEIRESQATP